MNKSERWDVIRFMEKASCGYREEVAEIAQRMILDWIDSDPKLKELAQDVLENDQKEYWYLS